MVSLEDNPHCPAIQSAINFSFSGEISHSVNFSVLFIITVVIYSTDAIILLYLHIGKVQHNFTLTGVAGQQVKV